MNGVHDMGGMGCFGAVDSHDEEELFHADWERRVLALVLAMGATGSWNLDQSRSARESLPPVTYLSAGYYRVWLHALENLLVQHELVTREELRDGQLRRTGKPLPRVLRAEAVAGTLANGAPVSRPCRREAAFHVGERVSVRNLHASGHTRLPAYIRSHSGTVHRVHGCHVFPDAHASGQGESPQWLYNVRFNARELWGEAASPGAVHVDCWEPYLIRARSS